jgi:hypothetical protein
VTAQIISLARLRMTVPAPHPVEVSCALALMNLPTRACQNGTREEVNEHRAEEDENSWS